MVLADDLRQSVLQAALQGKLTEQLETDSDVDELLINIQKEKEKLIADKKIKREKSLPEIQEDDIPFDIPKNWRWVRWGNLAYSIQYGYNAPAKNVGRIKMVRISDIQYNSVNWDAVPYCNINDEDIETYLLKENDILFARTGGTVGKTFLVNDILEDAIYAGYLIRTRYSDKLVPKYLKGFMESQLYWMQLQNGTTQGCQPNCNGQTLSKMLIPVPPVEEQQRIVDKVNEIMPKIDEYEKIEKELEALKKEFPINMKDAILQAAMQGKLTEQLESDSSVDELLLSIEEDRKNKINNGLIKNDKRLFIKYIDGDDVSYIIPNNWRTVTLGSIVYKLTDGTHKTPKYATEGVKFVSVKDMSSGKLDLSGTKFITQTEHDELYKRCNPEKGDMLLSKVGTTGVPAIIDTDEQFSLFVSVALLKYNHQFINEKFLYYLLMSPLVQEQVKENTRGVGNKNWVLDFIAKTIIVLPPIEEQQRIVEKLEVLLPLCDDLKE